MNACTQAGGTMDHEFYANYNKRSISPVFNYDAIQISSNATSFTIICTMLAVTKLKSSRSRLSTLKPKP
jgi:hypothetical protein